MKKIFIISLSLGLMFGCGNESNSHKQQDTEVSTKSNVMANTTATFGIEGMTCAHGCAATIEKKLAGLAGVKSAEVNFESKIATINYNSNDVDDIEMVNLVETMANNQYKVREVEIKSTKESVSTEDEGASNETGNILSVPSFEMPNIIEFFTNIL